MTGFCFLCLEGSLITATGGQPSPGIARSLVPALGLTAAVVSRSVFPTRSSRFVFRRSIRQGSANIVRALNLSKLFQACLRRCMPNTRSPSRFIDCIAVGVDRMQRNFEPMRKQVESWQKVNSTDVTAKVVIYEAFVEAKLEAPKHLARNVPDLYFEPKYEEFRTRTIWSLSNASTSAFKELDPIPGDSQTGKGSSSRHSGLIAQRQLVGDEELERGLPCDSRLPD
jgi:hypothetical protein